MTEQYTYNKGSNNEYVQYYIDTNDEHFPEFEFSSKGPADDNMPLIFVAYYPQEPDNPCYFNFKYLPKLTVYVNFLVPNAPGKHIFTNIKFKVKNTNTDIEKDIKKDISNDTSFIYYVNNPYDSITFYNDITYYKANELNYYAKNLGLTTGIDFSYYTTSSFDLNICLSIDDTLYLPNDDKRHNITINVARDTVGYLYLVPSYLYVAPIHSGRTSYINDYIWADPEKYGEVYKMACSGRSSDTGEKYDDWWTAGADGAARCSFVDLPIPVGCVRYSENKDTGANFNKYYMGVKLTTSIFEYKTYKEVTRDIYTYYSNTYLICNGISDNYICTTNKSPKSSTSYYGIDFDVQRYIDPYYSCVKDDQRGNMFVTYAKAFPQNNTYIALDRNIGIHSSREPTTTMPPQYWVKEKQRCWMNYVGIDNYDDIPDMILQGLICGGSFNDKNNDALGLYSAISLKGKNKNPNEIVFHAEKYSTYFNWSTRNESGRILRNQIDNSYMITGRLKSGGRSSTESAIWEKYRFDIWNNVQDYIDEYGLS